MIATTRYAAVAVALLSAGQPVDAFWRMSCSIIQMGRIDPVVSYGSVANHVHKVSGASSFNIDSTYDSLQQSECTSCSIQADKSAYWTPALYYQHANGMFEEVPNSGMAIYYLGRGVNNDGSTLAHPFPKGLKMLSGNSFARSQDMSTMTWGNSTYPPLLASEAVSMVCINYKDQTGSQTVNMTNMNCPNGFRAQIQMQSCWDGVNLYKADQSHVAHLSQIDNGACPPTHPILLPHLFYEVFYSVDRFVGGDGRFMFANGDQTGYGFHGDFINGWDTPTLTAAISECLIGNQNGVVEQCSAFTATNIDNFSSVCPERTPIFPCEPVHGTIAKLPGCINGTGYGATVTSKDVTCPGGNVASCSASANTTAPTPYAGDSIYTSLGCYTEATNSRALKDSSYVSTTNMTAEACIAFCAGSQYVGVEWSQECYCGSTLQAGSVTANASECNMDCTGNRWQICGGSKRLNIFSKKAVSSSTISSTSTSSLSSIASVTSPAVSSTTSASSSSSILATSTTSSARAFSTKYPNPAVVGNSSIGVWANQGCWTDNVQGRVLKDGGVYGSFMGSDPMSLEMCAAYCGSSKINAQFFGIEYHQECFCGLTLQSSSTFAVNQDDCSYTCPGNSSQYCGYGDRLNLYSLIASQTPLPTASRPASSTVVTTTTTSSLRSTSTSTTPTSSITRRRRARPVRV